MNIKISKRLVFIVLIISIGLNLLVFIIDTVPFVRPIIESKFFQEKKNNSRCKKS